MVYSTKKNETRGNVVRVIYILIVVMGCLANRSYAEMEKEAKIFVAGHQGLVGSAIVRALKKQGYTNFVLKTRQELDLCDGAAVDTFYAEENPDYVFIAAAKVGGILANSKYPAQFIHENISIQSNLIHGAYKAKVKKLLFLGSSCIYPKHCPQPILEEYLLTAPLEPTNEWYAIAKIAGLKLCEAYQKQYGARFISLMPTNLYGPCDNYDLQNSHVLPALIRKFIEAKKDNKKEVVIWGTGTPKREFLYVDDLAEAAIFAMDHYEGTQWLNVGTGEDITIKEVASLLAELVGYQGELVFDTSKPDGTPRKVLDVTKINELGWSAKTSLNEGLQQAISWYIENYDSQSMR